MLEGSQGVSYTKEHYHRFEKTTVGNEDGFPLITIFNVDIVIPPMDIKFSEDLGVLKAVNKIGDKR